MIALLKYGAALYIIMLIFLISCISAWLFYDFAFVPSEEIGAHWYNYENRKEHLVSNVLTLVFVTAMFLASIMGILYIFRKYIYYRKPYIIINSEGLGCIYCRDSILIPWDSIVTIEFSRENAGGVFKFLVPFNSLSVTINNASEYIKPTIFGVPSMISVRISSLTVVEQDIIDEIRKYVEIGGLESKNQ